MKAKAASRRRKRNLLPSPRPEEHEPTNVDGEEERTSEKKQGAKRGIVKENFGFAARQEDRS